MTAELELVETELEELQRLCSELEGLFKTTVSKAIRAGELLTHFKKQNRGKWEAWRKENLSISPMTAKRWVRLYKRSLESTNLVDLPLSEAYTLVQNTNPDGSSKTKKPRSKRKRGPKVVNQGEHTNGAKTEDKTPSGPLEVWISPNEKRTIADPFPTWRLINRERSPKQQAVVCTKCWTWTTGSIWGGEILKPNAWHFECECPNSDREAVSSKSETKKTREPKKTTKL